MISIPRPDVDPSRFQAIFNQEGPEPANVFNRWLKIGMMLVWFYLNLPELTQLLRFIHTLSSFNIVLLFCSIVAVALQGIRSKEQWSFSWDAPVQFLPLMMVGGVAIASVSLNWWIDLEPLSIFWFILGSYGVLGLFCPGRPWQQGLTFVSLFAGLMLVMVAEFTDVGHLVRTGIAEVVEYLIQPFGPLLGLQGLSSEDILVFDTGIAAVDIPCSGFKNIEIGSLFFIAASLITRKQMGFKWWLMGLTTFTLLIAANIARIFVLVILAFGLNQRPLADILHQPLGLCGFISVCLLSLYGLRLLPEECPAGTPHLGDRLGDKTIALKTLRLPCPSRPLIALAPVYRAPLCVTLVVLMMMVGLVWLPQPTHASTPAFSPTAWATTIEATSVQTESIGLNRYEQEFFARYPGVVAQKQRFHLGTISGSLITVAAPTWEAHHAPELCFTASGATIDHMEKTLLTDDVTGRWLSLNHGQNSATYWFQSPKSTTDHYFSRVWQEIRRQAPQWTMVSIQFDQPLSAQDAQVKALVENVHKSINAAMRLDATIESRTHS